MASSTCYTLATCATCGLRGVRVIFWSSVSTPTVRSANLVDHWLQTSSAPSSWLLWSQLITWCSSQRFPPIGCCASFVPTSTSKAPITTKPRCPKQAAPAKSALSWSSSPSPPAGRRPASLPASANDRLVQALQLVIREERDHQSSTATAFYQPHAGAKRLPKRIFQSFHIGVRL